MSLFGEKIKEIRLKYNYTQQEFAEILGYTSKSMIAHIENGDSEMSNGKISLLIERFEVDANLLFSSNKHNLVEDKKDVKELAKYLAPLVKELWGEHSISDLERILVGYISNEESTVFYKVIDGKYVGVALCALRHDYVEGCCTSPVGYLEGVFVDQKYRNKGIAKELCLECEKWAKRKGCSEFASDCELINNESLAFHLNIGFKEENRIICFKKEL